MGIEGGIVAQKGPARKPGVAFPEPSV